MLRIPGRFAYVPDGIFVQPVDRHIKTDIVRRGMANVFHDKIIGLTPDLIVPLPVSVQAQKDQVRLRQIDGKGAVGDHVDNEKSHLFCFHYQISEALLIVSPQERLSAAEKQNPHTHGIQLFHLSLDLPVRVDDSCDIVDRTVAAA